MKTILEQVTQEALALPANERSELTRALILSFETEPEEEAIEVNQSWSSEIARRVEEIESGKVKGIPSEEVFSKLRAKYG